MNDYLFLSFQEKVDLWVPSPLVGGMDVSLRIVELQVRVQSHKSLPKSECHTVKRFTSSNWKTYSPKEKTKQLKRDGLLTIECLSEQGYWFVRVYLIKISLSITQLKTGRHEFLVFLTYVTSSCTESPLFPEEGRSYGWDTLVLETVSSTVGVVDGSTDCV